MATTALDRLLSRTPAPSPLRTREWAEVPQALRDRAFFTAGLENAQLLTQIQSSLADYLAQPGASAAASPGLGGGSPTLGRADFVAQIRDLLGAEGDTRKLTDLASYRRLNLIRDMAVEDSREFARFKTENEDPALLDAFPAQELVRISPVKAPRDWTARWTAAGGTLTDGRMIALKNSPIWTKISRFGKPYPPFDFGSGMGLEDIERDEAETLGLLRPTDTVRPTPVPDYNAAVKVSIAQLDPALLATLRTALPKLKITSTTATLA